MQVFLRKVNKYNYLNEHTSGTPKLMTIGTRFANRCDK